MCAAVCVQVVFTPHAYPPSITLASFLGTTLWEQCRTSFGYLQTDGEQHTWPASPIDLHRHGFDRFDSRDVKSLV